MPSRRRARSRRFVPLVPILLAAAPSAWAQPPSEDALRPYLTANGLLNRGLYDLAITEYRAFIEANPRDDRAATARYGLAVCLFRLNRFDEAAPELDRLLEVADFTYTPEVLLLRGHCALGAADFALATTCFERVVRDHGSHASAPDAAALLVESLQRAGRNDEAAKAGADATRRWPEGAQRDRAELFWGLAETARGRPAQAAERFAAILARTPEGAIAEQAGLLLAQAQHRAGQLPQALAQYQAVARNGPERLVPDAMLGAAQILQRQGDARQAATLADDLLRRFPESGAAPGAWLLRGRACFDLDDPTGARAAFERVATSGDASLHDDAAYWLAKCSLREGNAPDAAARLAEAGASFPQSELLPEMLYDRAIALSRIEGDPAAAIEAMGQFRERFAQHPLAPGALQAQASLEHRRSRYDASLALCEEFLRSYPGHEQAPGVAFLAAENDYLARRFDRAEGRYRHFLEQHPGDALAPAATFRRGMALHRLGRNDEARPLLLASAASGRDGGPFRPALLALGEGAFDAGAWAEAERHLTAYLGPDGASPALDGADDALLKLAIARLRQDNPTRALESLDELIRSHPDSPQTLQARFERAQALVTLHRDAEAKAEFEAVLAIDERSRFAPYALNHLGAIAARAGDPDTAAAFYGRVADSGAAEDLIPESLFQRGLTLLGAGRYPEAIDALTRLIDDHPRHERAPAARAHRAIATIRSGDAEGGLREIAQVERRAPGLDADLRRSVMYEKAWALRELDREDEAVAANRALLDDGVPAPLRVYALLDLAGLHMKAQRHAEAARLLAEAQRLGPDSGSALPSEVLAQVAYRQGVCALKLERYADAAACLAGFQRDFPESDLDHSADLVCAEALLKLGRHREAAEHLQRLVDADPDAEFLAPALLRLGEARAGQGQWPASEEAFRRYLDAFKDGELWFQARFGVGWACENLRRFDEALAAYREVVARHQGPTAARAQFQIGECLFAQRRHDDAIRELLRVDILYAYPEWSAAALFEAGRCFEETARPEDARRQYEQVRDRFASSRWATLAAERLGKLATPPPPRGG